ncbi:MAG: hypothetical protein JOZ81_19840 [Chloroflexi bacterium]|nr:hypothetical protein [Chloroflexota bacterium]MBV9547043.1 hypothetical protein [Chloroflexota bacterium]
MIEHQPRTFGLSGDHGWNDEEEPTPSPFGTLALILGHGAYWISVWLLAAPLPAARLASRRRKAEGKA